MKRCHNIVADRWAGAFNPQPHPNPTSQPPYRTFTPTHSHPVSHMITTTASLMHIFCIFNSRVTDGLSLLWSCMSAYKDGIYPFPVAYSVYYQGHQTAPRLWKIRRGSNTKNCLQFQPAYQPAYQPNSYI